jgi:hypothetical protein
MKVQRERDDPVRNHPLFKPIPYQSEMLWKITKTGSESMNSLGQKHNEVDLLQQSLDDFFRKEERSLVDLRLTIAEVIAVLTELEQHLGAKNE